MLSSLVCERVAFWTIVIATVSSVVVWGAEKCDGLIGKKYRSQNEGVKSPQGREPNHTKKHGLGQGFEGTIQDLFSFFLFVCVFS